MRKKFLGHTWLGWLNLLLLQWFFLRLIEIVDASRNHYKWRLFFGIVPTTGWNTKYKFVWKVKGLA